MPFEYTSPSQDLPLRRFSVPSSEYFVDVQTIGSQDKESESGDHVHTLTSGMLCENVLVLNVIKTLRSPRSASEITVRSYSLSTFTFLCPPDRRPKRYP